MNKQNKSFLASGSRDRIIHVFDANKGFELIASLDVHSSSVCAIRFGICN